MKFLKGLIVSLVIVLLTFISNRFFGSYINIIHTFIEIACIFFSISTFVHVWYTYDRTTRVHHIIGFGLLVVTFFNVLHTLSYKGLPFFIKEYSDLSLRYSLIGNLALAIVFILISSNNFKFHISRWRVLIIAVVGPIILSYLVYIFPHAIPNLRSDNGFLTWRIPIEIFILTILFIGLFRLKKIKPGHLVANDIVFLALLLAIPAEIGMFLGKGSIFVLPHLFKLLSFYFLFKGTYVSAIVYPYEKLENILDSLDTGLITSNDNLYVTYVNKKMEDILGYKKQDLIGKPSVELAKRFQPERTQKLIIENVSDTERSKIGNLQDLIDIQGNKVKVRTDVQKLLCGGVISIFYDAKKEQELENLQIQTQTILDSIQNFVFIVDKNHNIILCNKAFAKLVGIKVNAIIGMGLMELNKIIHFSISEEKEKAKKDYLDENKKATMAKLIDTNGLGKEIIYNSGPIINFDGEVIGMIQTGVEVTDYKLEQERLKQQEKLAVLGQMAAGIVHEIRNPLTTLKGFAQLINNKTVNDSIKEYACTMENEVDNINHIVSDFLTFAKPQFPVLEEVSLNSLLQSLSLLVETKSFIEDVDIQLTLTADEKMIFGDKFQLRQVILNIVKNGIEAMGQVENRRLDIKTAFNDKKGEMQVTITDNGQGMKQEDIPKVGTPFFTTKEKGTGLGLSICYQIIKEHGGHVEIISELGKGTSFIISLPCIK